MYREVCFAVLLFSPAAPLVSKIGPWPNTDEIELASLYEQAYRLDEAEELVERSVRAGLDSPIVSLVQGRIQRRQNRIEPAKSTYQSFIERLPADSVWAYQAWSDLALIKNREGDFDGASDAI